MRPSCHYWKFHEMFYDSVVFHLNFLHCYFDPCAARASIPALVDMETGTLAVDNDNVVAGTLSVDGSFGAEIVRGYTDLAENTVVGVVVDGGIVFVVVECFGVAGLVEFERIVILALVACRTDGIVAVVVVVVVGIVADSVVVGMEFDCIVVDCTIPLVEYVVEVVDSSH